MRFVLACGFILVLASVCAACARASKSTLPAEQGSAAAREIEVPAGDVTLHARVAGGIAPAPVPGGGDRRSGSVLIAIHGGPGMSSDYMIGLEQLAGPDLAVVTYDQRGTGRSTSPPANASSYDLLQYVADLEAVRQAVGAEQVYLFGHSWGGVVAMRYATVHPQRVRAIVLMGSGPPNAEAARAGQVRLARRIARLQEQGIIPQRISALEEILLAYIADPGAGLPDALRDLDYNATVEQLTWAALDDYDFTAEVARLDCPVLMLWGESDPFGLPMAEATRSALSAAGERTRSPVEFVLLQGCGHFWHECPDAFFGQVRSFLDRAADPAV